MKKLILLLFILGTAVGATMAQPVQNVDAVKFQELVKAGNALILDVRTPGEYSRGHIAGSTNIDISSPDFVSRTNLLQKDKTLLIYCLSGSRSDAAAAYLSRQGFKKIVTLDHGIMPWVQRGFALEKSAQSEKTDAVAYTEQGFKKILTDHKLVLVDFQAAWCAPCKAMNPVVDRVAADFKGKARVEKVDVDANKSLATAYQVGSIPGFVLFKGGQKVWSHAGTISYEELSGTIKKYL